MRNTLSLTGHGRWFGILLALAGLVVLTARQAAASINLVISPATSNVAAGSNNDAFDVTLTNTGTGSVAVGAFAFELSTSSSYIDFTSTTISTTAAPYIFAGSSVFGPTISTVTGGTLEASDVTSLSSSGVTVASGATVGLGHVFFNVSPSAPTTDIPVTFTGFPNTSLTDPLDNNIPIGLLASGMIDIQASVAAVPEPSMFTIYGVGIGMVAVFEISRSRRRRVARQ